MALHFGYEKVKDKALHSDPDDATKWHPIGDVLVWYSMSCGFSSIHKGNVDKVWRRVALHERVHGAGYSRGAAEDTEEPAIARIARWAAESVRKQ